MNRVQVICLNHKVTEQINLASQGTTDHSSFLLLLFKHKFVFVSMGVEGQGGAIKGAPFKVLNGSAEQVWQGGESASGFSSDDSVFLFISAFWG